MTIKIRLRPISARNWDNNMKPAIRLRLGRNNPFLARHMGTDHNQEMFWQLRAVCNIQLTEDITFTARAGSVAFVLVSFHKVFVTRASLIIIYNNLE